LEFGLGANNPIQEISTVTKPSEPMEEAKTHIRAVSPVTQKTLPSYAGYKKCTI
jgi:hypothetical protein